jgi:hypothetical protein
MECGFEWRPMKRVGWMRRRGQCPECRRRSLREDEVLLNLDRASAWADTPLLLLGLPRQHLCLVR